MKYTIVLLIGALASTTQGLMLNDDVRVPSSPELHQLSLLSEQDPINFEDPIRQ